MAAAAAAVAAGSPARTGQQQQAQVGGVYGSVGSVGGVGVGAGVGVVPGTGVGVGVGVGNAAGARNRSASTILELGQSGTLGGSQGAHTRKYSSGGNAGLLAGDVNGYGDNAATAKCDTYNGVGTGAGSGVGVGVGVGVAGRGIPQERSSIGSVNVPVTTVSSLGITLRERLSSVSGASSASGTTGEAGLSASAGGAAGGSAPTIGGSGGSGSVPHCKRQGSFSNVFSKLIDGTSAGTMFAKFKSANVAAATSTQNVAEGNPITQYFEIGKPVASAGPELIWRIHDGYRKSDNKVSAPNNLLLLQLQPQPRPQSTLV